MVGVCEELAVAEVAAQQAELPEVIGNVLADVGDGAVGADDDLGVFVDLARLTAAAPGRDITQQPLFLPSVSK